jgi:hypothetical protein
MRVFAHNTCDKDIFRVCVKVHQPGVTCRSYELGGGEAFDNDEAAGSAPAHASMSASAASTHYAMVHDTRDPSHAHVHDEQAATIADVVSAVAEMQVTFPCPPQPAIAKTAAASRHAFSVTQNSI